MATAPSNDLIQRLTELEQLVRDLRARVRALERQLALRAEHPVDQMAVGEPVRYDWQQ